MSTSFLEGLSSDEKKQALLRVSRFILRPPAKEVRESLYKRLIEIGIFLLEREEKVDLENILKIIKEQFFGILLVEEDARNYLNKLQEENVVIMRSGKLVLSQQRKSEIEDYSRKSLSLISSTEVKLLERISKVHESISDDDRIEIMNGFYQFIIFLVSKYIVNAAKLLVRGKLTSISVSTGEAITKAATSAISNQTLRKAVQQVLIEWMQNPDDAFVEYLFNMRQNFLCLEVLNLDPDCKMMQREIFSEKRMFLDTNILLGLVLPSVETHEQTKELISNTQILGCSVLASRRTIDEFNYVLGRAQDLHNRVKATPKQKMGMQNPFTRSYATTQREGNPLSWEEYVSQFSDMPTFLGKLGIEIYDEEHEDIKDLDRYSDTIKAIQRCFRIHRRRDKPDYIAEHDAFHLLLIKTLRKNEVSTSFGPNTWFLTFDLTLPCVDRFIGRSFAFSDQASPCMIGYLWDELISPFLMGIVEEKKLVDVFRHFIISDFTPISEDMNTEVLLKLKIDWTEYDWLEFEEIQSLLQEQFVLDYVKQLEELTHAGNHDAVEKLETEFSIAFNSLIGRISSRKIDKIKQQLDEKEKETQMLTEAVQGLEKSREKLRGSLTSEETLAIRMRYGAGIAGFILLAVGILEIIRGWIETATWHLAASYIACLIIGALLLLMAIRPEQVSGTLGFGKKG